MSSWLDRAPITRFDECPNKEFVHNAQYAFVKRFVKSNVMAVPGPAFQRHVDGAFEIASTPASRVLFVELDPTIYAYLQNCRKELLEAGDWRAKKLQIVRGDVASYEVFAGLQRPYRFEDIDLCQSLDNSFEIIRYRLRKQSRIYYLNKAMVVTSTLRHSIKGVASMENTLQLLNNILSLIGGKLNVKATMAESNTQVLATNQVNGRSVSVFGMTPVFEEKGRLSDIRLYRYRDRVGVFSCVILYK